MPQILPSKKIVVLGTKISGAVIANICSTIILLVGLYFGGRKWAIFLAIAFFPLKYLILSLVLNYQQKNGVAEKAFAEETSKAIDRYRSKKSSIYAENLDIRRKDYKIVHLEPHPDHVGSWIVGYHPDNQIDDKFLPVVTMDGNVLTVKRSGDKVITFGNKFINSTEEFLEFVSYPENWIQPNPYFCKDEKPQVSWQCEGHKHQKVIQIDGASFPHAHENACYALDLFINGRKRATYNGRFDRERNLIVVPIADVKKQDCAQKECVIKFAFDDSRNMTLPQPKILVPVNA